MKAIRKYKLSINQVDNPLNLKWGYRFLHSEYVVVNKALYIWVKEPLAAPTQTVQVKLKVVKSGEPLPNSCSHIATAIDSYLPKAYHIFFDSSLEKQVPEDLHLVRNSNVD